MLQIIIYSAIIGIIGGGCIAAGAARMFHAPEIQSMGAFRTLGELNACNGDPIAHFSFGLGFFFSAAASAVAAGSLTQDVMHRIVPNWSAAALLVKNNKVEETVQNPRKMMMAGSVVGGLVVIFLNTMASIIPEKLSLIASEVLGPATTWLINPVMPAIFWLAAIDAGKTTGMWGTVLGGVSALITGNATPGVVLGILIGKSAEENGYKSKVVQILIAIVVILFVAIAYFRGFFGKF
ncbi:DUF4311 domain-containing protein [Laedolimicola ammoniilytica]|uniref:DUF4311 domain-containing protein n=1 Tax=Laedolimicola ammoniilytica TaxID=2981771 RepID=A0ABT2RUN9_9FIRM|nr:DUF4311 domain-containing protein [Laedolimicola ammoniilytica]MCU6696033.1 DUF4311 domain-containing protein [Laedolimicola ammoniilytica]SCH41789.1 Uncharacterised protein [uncultured Clostridium sp.]SCH71658.1 Uncharacterised protein [uncultured Clostridium sp.]